LEVIAYVPSNTSLERTREGSSTKLKRRLARRSTQLLGRQICNIVAGGKDERFCHSIDRGDSDGVIVNGVGGESDDLDTRRSLEAPIRRAASNAKQGIRLERLLWTRG
jgi:hypothetical protein